ncbi:MAG: modification methylase [Chloroflexota bacterium]|nr:modification methylase [Chloroflexota bacterium]
MANRNLHRAKNAKYDEFYTQLSDISDELRHYKKHFRDKVVYCNCDDPTVSNFFHYFAYGFRRLKLKKLITTCYKSRERDLFSQHDVQKAIWLQYDGQLIENRIPDPEQIGIHHLDGDGDFRSEECVELLKQADIVVTNPPFSLFREYVAQLVEYDKKFIIIGDKNIITYKEIFPLIKAGKMWVGYKTMSGGLYMDVPQHRVEEIKANYSKGSYKIFDGVLKFFARACWYTNLPHRRRNEEIILTETYSPEKYPRYDNYDAIEVSRVEYIPKDWDGAMGVPITFLNKFNPDQFEIIKFRKGDDEKDLRINGKEPYFRILIRNKKLSQ